MNRIDSATTFWALPAATAEGLINALMAPRPEPSAITTSSDALGAMPDDAAARRGYELRDGVAVIHIDGALARTAESPCWFGAGVEGYDRLRGVIDAALADPQACAVLLDICSPGGQVAGCQELADHIRASRGRKPMAAYTNGMMASAAYWLGSATGRIYATQTAEVGSIGVVMTIANRSKMLEEAGIRVHVLTAGTMKAAGSPFTELTDEQAAYFQKSLDSIHAVFRAHVAGCMRCDPAKAEEWGDGRCFLASEALPLGLVSAVVSGSDEALTLLLKESRMDRETLLAQAPELAESLRAEGRAEADADAQARLAATVAVAKKLMTAEAAARLDGFLATCAEQAFSPAQMEAVAAMAFAGDEARARADEEAMARARADALAAISAATPSSVPADAGAAPRDFAALVSDYARKNNCSRGQATSACVAAYPEEHAAWLASVNGSAKE